MPHLAARWTAPLLLVLACVPRLAAQPTDQPLPTIDSMLVLDRVGEGRRSPVNTDAIEHALATGIWTTPHEGDEVTDPEGDTHAWRALEPGENGDFRDRALAGGWAFATVTLDEPRDLLLKASGHRHVYVNGEPRVGDLYSLGITTIPLHLNAGDNTLLFKGGRGSLSVEFLNPPAPVFLETRDPTLPDQLRGDPQLLELGVILTNATGDWTSDLIVVAENSANDGVLAFTADSAIDPLPPYSSREVRVQAPSIMAPGFEGDASTIRLTLMHDDDPAGEPIEFELRVREPNEKHVRTFVSEIDGSVQYYAVTPPPGATLETPADPQAFVLSLHGASVEARNQAGSYEAKPGMFIVAPTNRRPFGFDWEDWGRLDAIEVLGLASKTFNADPARTYLTGHSMGAHGTWINGAYFAPRFAVIAPSAGWRDFWSYGGGGEFESETPITSILDRAANASRTLLMKDNYASTGVYILHGDTDDNVPVDQARFMREQLAQFHPNFAYFEQAGAGHWWGNRCVDWPPIFEFFAHNTVDPHPARVDFTTVDPGISASSAWVTIEQQLVAREPSRVIASYDAKANRVSVSATNTLAVSLDLSHWRAIQPADPESGLTVSINGHDVSAEGDALYAAMDELGVWSQTARDSAHKNPDRNGPFKDAFRHRVLFVVGTRGTAEENAWALAKARYDAETFWYRGNGSVQVVRDTGFDPEAEPDRSVILYGNADTNGAWNALLSDSPIRPGNDAITLPERDGAGTRTLATNALACVLARPRPGSDVAMVGVVGGTGLPGMRATNQLAYFVSGAHFPDWLIASTDLLSRGELGVIGAGFFAADWSLGTDSAVLAPDRMMSVPGTRSFELWRARLDRDSSPSGR